MADQFTQVRGQGVSEDPRPTRKNGSVYECISTDVGESIADEVTPVPDVEARRALGKPVTPTR